MAGDENDAFSSLNIKNVPDAAKAWGQTIAGLFTIGGVVTIIQGEANLADLTLWFQIAAGGALVLALGLAVFAVIMAFLVAWEEVTKKSEGQLKASIGATAVSVALLALAAWIIWKGDQVESAQSYLVTFEDRTVACGSLERDGETLTLSGRELADVALIEETAGCPAGA